MSAHERIWAAIDELARRNALSVSGLARKAGLDSTAFNKSKRMSADGRPRWPSTESVFKVIAATGARGREAAVLFGIEFEEEWRAQALPVQSRSVPLLGLAQAGPGGFYEDAAFPEGEGLDLVALPVMAGDGRYAVQVKGSSMLPLYRDGDTLVVDPAATVRRGDRVVAKTRSGEVMAKVLARQTAREVELESLNPDHPTRMIAMTEIEWLARIVWASQ